MILDEIIKDKVKEVVRLRTGTISPIEPGQLPAVNDLAAALKSPGINLIAEIKSKSPSAGVMIKDYDPVNIAGIYERSGARAISVLTDSKYFGGSIEHITKVKNAVKIPILRKDFIIDEVQIHESRLAGADAILLIVRILQPDELKGLIKYADGLGMSCLVEVHSEDEARIALDAGANIIGINNRDLDTLQVDINTTANILSAVPELKEKIIVSESGIGNKKDVDLLKNIGVNAILIGEAILKAPDMGQKIHELNS